jgi:hypothetical protein
MTVQKRQNSLVDEAKALQFFFNVSSDKLALAFKSFDALYESKDPVTSDEFTDAQNAIDVEIDDLCIKHKIPQEKLEELMENNFSFRSVTL